MEMTCCSSASRLRVAEFSTQLVLACHRMAISAHRRRGICINIRPQNPANESVTQSDCLCGKVERKIGFLFPSRGFSNRSHWQFICRGKCPRVAVIDATFNFGKLVYKLVGYALIQIKREGKKKNEACNLNSSLGECSRYRLKVSSTSNVSAGFPERWQLVKTSQRTIAEPSSCGRTSFRFTLKFTEQSVP